MKEDREFLLLENIHENRNISQRELSKKLGISLGSINMLLNKMVKEGLIKAQTIPAKRVAYMLTPKGMVEKANKTYQYIQRHYKYINETKGRVKEYLQELMKQQDSVIVFLNQKEEIDQLIIKAIEEIDHHQRIKIVEDKEEISKYQNAIVLSTGTQKVDGVDKVNVLEEI